MLILCDSFFLCVCLFELFSPAIRYELTLSRLTQMSYAVFRLTNCLRPTDSSYQLQLLTCAYHNIRRRPSKLLQLSCFVLLQLKSPFWG